MGSGTFIGSPYGYYEDDELDEFGGLNPLEGELDFMEGDIFYADSGDDESVSGGNSFFYLHDIDNYTEDDDDDYVPESFSDDEEDMETESPLILVNSGEEICIDDLEEDEYDEDEDSLSLHIDEDYIEDNTENVDSNADNITTTSITDHQLEETPKLKSIQDDEDDDV